MTGTGPTPQSLVFRASLAQLVSPLRRVRSRTPFFHLAAHRIPTLWSLYRGLLRYSPTEHVEFRIRALLHKNQYLTSVNETRKRLEQGYKWLEIFKAATDGNRHCQEVLARYSRLIKYKRNQADLARLFRNEMEDRLRMRTRPIYTGGFLRPTLYHGPLPRMKPQPEHISMCIKNRVRARERRIQFKSRLLEDLNDLELESHFEEGLMKLTNLDFTCFFSPRDVLDGWAEPIQYCLEEIAEKEQKERERANLPFRPEMVEAIFEARREKIRNKTREKERERHGELTLSAIRRERKGPPAPVLAKMSPERRKMDKVARSLSEVGYVALVKGRLGRKLKDPEAALELGEKENRTLLDRATEMIRRENRRRVENEERRNERVNSCQ